MAAAAAGKHVYCEKPFTLSKKEAEAAVDAVRKAKRVVGVGYNRRFHPEMIKLRERIRSGELGTIQHIEATHDLSQCAVPAADGMARNKAEAPLGGLAPMGVHAIDGMIYLVRRDRPGLSARALRRVGRRPAPTTPRRCCSA